MDLWNQCTRPHSAMGADLPDRRRGRACCRTPRSSAHCKWWKEGLSGKIAKGSRRRSAGRCSAAASRGRLPKKLVCFGFGRPAMPAEKVQVVQKVRQKHSLKILLSIAQLPRATFYYRLKWMKQADKYDTARAEITAIIMRTKDATVIGVSQQNCITGISP